MNGITRFFASVFGGFFDQLLADPVSTLFEQLRGGLALGHFFFALLYQRVNLFTGHGGKSRKAQGVGRWTLAENRRNRTLSLFYAPDITLVHWGQRRAAIGICEVHSGHSLVTSTTGAAGRRLLTQRMMKNKAKATITKSNRLLRKIGRNQVLPKAATYILNHYSTRISIKRIIPG